jgi:hypothetical protein
MLGSYLNSDFKAFLSAYRHTGLDDLHICGFVCASSPVIELLLRVCFIIIILFAFLYL